MSAEIDRCQPRQFCACGRLYEAHGCDGRAGEIVDLCDGTRATLPVTWTARADASRCLPSCDDDMLRNYEIEDRLGLELGGRWIVAGPCPFNGVYTASRGAWREADWLPHRSRP